MIFKNYTPHVVRIINDVDDTIEIPACGIIARVTEETILTRRCDNIQIREIRMNGVINLPAPEEGVGLIVSRAVAVELPNRRDLYIPDQQVRDKENRVQGCRGLGQVLAPEEK